MSRPQSCPISGKMVDSNACRICAFFTLLILVVAQVTGAFWLVGLLALEFAVRLWRGLGKSPLGWLSLKISRSLGLIPVMVDAAPKRFAGGIALVLSVAALLTGAMWGTQTAYTSIIVVFAGCAVLEAFFGVCLGCYVHAWLPKRQVHKSEPGEVA